MPHAAPPPRAPFLRDECGAITMQWMYVLALLLIAAILAYPDLGYDLHQALRRSGIDIRFPGPWAY